MKKVVLGILVVLVLSSCCLFTYLFVKVRQITYINNSFQNLYEDATTLSEDGSIAAVEPSDVHDILVRARTETQTLKDAVDPYLFLAPLLQSSSEFGPYASDVDQYVELMDAVSILGKQFAPEIESGLRIVQSESYMNKATTPQLLALLADATPKLDAALPEIERAQNAYAAIENKEDIPEAYQQYVPLLDAYLPLADEGIELLKLLPTLTSVNSASRSYLLLVQNESDGANSGVIQEVGVIQVENGNVTDITIDSQFLVSIVTDASINGRVSAMLTDLLNHGEFRQGQPDFGMVSAEVATVFEQQYPEFSAISGVIVIDQQFMQLLDTAVGPIDVADTEAALLTANQRFSSELMTLHLPTVFDKMQEARSENHMRLWLTREHEENTLHQIFGEDVEK